MEFSQIDMNKVHPVDRYGYDPLPFNHGEYVWVKESESWEPGTYTYAWDADKGYITKGGYTLKGSYEV